MQQVMSREHTLDLGLHWPWQERLNLDVCSTAVHYSIWIYFLILVSLAQKKKKKAGGWERESDRERTSALSIREHIVNYFICTIFVIWHTFSEYYSKCDLTATQKLLYHILYGDFFLQYLSCFLCVLLRKMSFCSPRPSTMNLRVRAESSHASVWNTHVFVFLQMYHAWWPFQSHFPSLLLGGCMPFEEAAAEWKWTETHNATHLRGMFSWA